MKHYVYWKRKWRNNDLFKNNGIIQAVVFFVQKNFSTGIENSEYTYSRSFVVVE